MDDTQVLVVGAGPVGMTLALALRRQGLAVRIVDKSATRTDQSRALVIWPRTLELLDIQGCAERFIAAGLPAHGARVIGDGQELVHARFDIARSAYPYALMIPQSDTERLLEALLAEAGVQVDRRTELLAFVDDGLRVRARLRRADGREEDASAGWLAACDGAHSTVRHALGLAFDGDTMESGWMLANVRIDGELPNDVLTIGWQSAGVIAYFPMGERRFRVIAETGPADPGASVPSLAEVQSLIDERGPEGLRARDPVWLSRFGINERKVADYRHGRIFLAGDAAHVHSPAGGQGMNTGMQDAFNLAWKLAMVERGMAVPGLLDSYSSERSAIGDQVLRNTGRMTRIAMLESPLLRDLRDRVAGALGQLPAVQRRLVDQLTELDLHYSHSPLSVTPRGAARHPAAGARAPDLVLGDTRLHSLLGRGRFVLLSVGVDPPEVPVDVDRLVSTAVAPGAGEYDGAHHFLVRPDGYLALSAPGDDASPILEFLRRLGGRPATP